MDVIYSYRNNCYNLTEDQYVKEWTDNQTTDTLIEVAAYPYAPHLFYTEWNDTHYEWCGHMLLIAEYFARFSKTRIKLPRFQNPEQQINRFMSEGVEGLPNLGLVPVTASNYYRFIVAMDVTGFARLSPIVTYVPLDGILATTKIGKDSLLKQFNCFEPGVYYAILLAIIIISFIMGFYEHSLKSMVNKFWTSFSVILCNCYSIEKSSNFEAILSGVWLMSCTVLLAAFSGQLRDQLLKPKPIYWINSFDDLYEWKDLRIQVFGLCELSNYLNNFPSEARAIDFNSRAYNFTEDVFTEGYNNLENVLDYQGVKSGEVAIVHGYEYLHVFKRVLEKEGYKQDIDFHIGSEPSQPIFLISNKLNFEDSLAVKLHSVINVLRESGIYDTLIKIGLNPKRFGRDYDEKIVQDNYKFGEFSIMQMKGIFILCSIFSTISVVIILIEIILNL